MKAGNYSTEVICLYSRYCTFVVLKFQCNFVARKPTIYMYITNRSTHPRHFTNINKMTRKYDVVSEPFQFEIFQKSPDFWKNFKENEHKSRLWRKTVNLMRRGFLYSWSRFHFGCRENARKRQRHAHRHSVVISGKYLNYS